ncbi:MAG: hypothetical protein WAW41_04850 [Methylobacter sp.]
MADEPVRALRHIKHERVDYVAPAKQLIFLARNIGAGIHQGVLLRLY